MKLKIRSQLVLAFAVVLGLMLISSTVVFWRATTVNRKIEFVKETQAPSLLSASAVGLGLTKPRSDVRRVMLYMSIGKTEEARQYQQKLEADWKLVDAAFAPLPEMSQRFSSQEDKERVARLAVELPILHQEQTAIVAAALAAGQDKIAAINSELERDIEPHGAAAGAAAEGLGQSVSSLVTKDLEQLRKGQHESQLILAFSTLFSLATGIITVLVFSGKIVGALTLVVERLKEIAGGDLSGVRLPATLLSRPDELGDLATASQTMSENLRSVLGTVAQGAEKLSAAAAQMNARALESHGNAQSQAGKTGHIANAAQEMKAVIREISQSAESASASSRESAETATLGGAVMEAAAATMERIATATQTVAERMDSLAHLSVEIGNVVGVIKDISEQTNLLALNAAIEAARAGEHGRGFAVVAGEVRRLAERTHVATQEIATSIRNIQDETRSTVEVMSSSRDAVEMGIGETARARTSLEVIIKSSKHVESQIYLIATAATEQTASSGEIAESAFEISKLATDSSNASEETTEACKGLSVLARDLDEIIRQFRIDKNTESRKPGSTSGLKSDPAFRPSAAVNRR